MFSKFKLQKPANVPYRRGSKPYEREHRTDFISVPLLEQYDLVIRELRTENEHLKSLMTEQHHELIKARAEAFQLREELTLLRNEVAQSRLPVDRTKNSFKFNSSKKNFWECDKASRSQKRKKIRELMLNAVEKLPTEFTPVEVSFFTRFVFHLHLHLHHHLFIHSSYSHLTFTKQTEPSHEV